MSTFLCLGLIALIAPLARNAWRDRHFVRATYKAALKPRIMFIAATLLLITLYTAHALLQYEFASAGLARLLLSSGSNILISPAIEAQTGQGALPALPIALVTLAYLSVILMILPGLARNEEITYRDGRHTPTRIVAASVSFGLTHQMMGIPIAGALALIVPGLHLGFVYADMAKSQSPAEAIRHCTAVHTSFNFLVVCLCAGALTLFSLASGELKHSMQAGFEAASTIDKTEAP